MMVLTVLETNIYGEIEGLHNEFGVEITGTAAVKRSAPSVR